jgi:hypothetical protein
MAWGVPKLGAVAEAASGNLTLAEPAGTAEGDLQIACIAIRSTVGFTNSDWLKIEGQLSGDTDATNGIASGEMWYRVRGAAAGTLQFSRTGGDLGRGCIIGYTGGKQNATVVLGNHSSNTLGAASATATTGTISTTEATELIVAMSSAGDNLTASAFDATDPSTASGATDTTTVPTAGTWIERTDTGTNTGADGGLAVADAVRATAGATGTIQTTISASARHVMIASAFRMLVDTAVAAGVGALLATGFAPSVSTTSNTQVTAGVGAVVATGFSPTVTASSHQTVSAGVGELTATGFVPSVVINTTIATDIGALVLAGLAPTVIASDHQTVSTLVGALALTGFSPDVSVGAATTAEPGVGVLALVGHAPTVTATAHVRVDTALGVLLATGFAPVVELPVVVSPSVGTLVLTGYAPDVEAAGGPVEVTPGVGVLTVTGYAPEIPVHELTGIDSSAPALVIGVCCAPALVVADASTHALSRADLSRPALGNADASAPSLTTYPL